MHAIRKAGNTAAHNAQSIEAEKITVKNFIAVMAYFNGIKRNEHIL